SKRWNSSSGILKRARRQPKKRRNPKKGSLHRPKRRIARGKAIGVGAATIRRGPRGNRRARKRGKSASSGEKDHPHPIRRQRLRLLQRPIPTARLEESPNPRIRTVFRRVRRKRIVPGSLQFRCVGKRG